MSTIDEILATGWYTDKRGRSWRHLPLSGRWADQVIDHKGIHWAGQKIEADQMRLLIERDQHRGKCHGAWHCTTYPVPFVYRTLFGKWAVMPARSGRALKEIHLLREDAMDVARALAARS